MLPGQVENWVFIVDLKGMGLTSLPLGVSMMRWDDKLEGLRESIHKSRIFLHTI